MAKRICEICGKPSTGQPGRGLNWDHIIPKSLGGPDEKWNLRLTHKDCNNDRRNHFLREDMQLAMTRKAAWEAKKNNNS